MKNGLSLYLKHKQGFILPYTLLTCIFVLNIVIFIVLCSLNTKKYYENLDNYYHVILLERRAIHLIETKINENDIQLNRGIQRIENDYKVYIIFTKFKSNQYEVRFELYYLDIYEYGIIYYDITTNTYTIVYG